MSSRREEIQGAIHTGRSLLKYAYQSTGAFAWDSLRGGEDFAVGGREMEALKKIVLRAQPLLRTEAAQGIELIHVGSGNGVEIPVFLNLFQLGKRDAYVALDISQELLDLVKARQGEALQKKVSSVRYLKADVESAFPFSAVAGEKRTPVVVASGEGTLLSNGDVLRHLAGAFGDESYLMLSLDGLSSDRVAAVCAEYDSPQVRAFLRHAVAVAGECGAISSTEGQFLPARYDEKLSQLIVVYRLTSGEDLVLLRSWKPQSPSALTHRLMELGFGVVAIEPVAGAYGVLARKLNP